MSTAIIRTVSLFFILGFANQSAIAGGFRVTLVNKCEGMENSNFEIEGSALSYLSEVWYDRAKIDQEKLVLSSDTDKNTFELYFSPRDAENSKELEFRNHFGGFILDFVAFKNWSGVVYTPYLRDMKNGNVSSALDIGDRYKVELQYGKNSCTVNILAK